MDIVYNYLSLIRERPGLYLGTKSLELLKADIDGYIEMQKEIDPAFEGGVFERLSRVCPRSL